MQAANQSQQLACHPKSAVALLILSVAVVPVLKANVSLLLKVACGALLLGIACALQLLDAHSFGFTHVHALFSTKEGGQGVHWVVNRDPGIRVHLCIGCITHCMHCMSSSMVNQLMVCAVLHTITA
jgi:hypothetical protein